MDDEPESAIGISYRWPLTADPSAPAVARGHINANLNARGVPEPVIDVMALLTSEVVTNARLHGGEALDLELVISDRVLRVAVGDPCPSPPVVLSDPSADAGRGMRMVEQLAGTWGTTDTDDGKRVWFEVPYTF